MSIQIKLKNSVVQDSTPSTSDLPAVGEIALNANINSIGGFMRASDNSIVKIFGPGSLSTPTATTTVSGISELATNTETTTGSATNRVVTPAGLNAVTVAERSTSNSTYLALAGGTLTGVVAATAGSNSAPSIHFGDSDSGIFGGTNTVSLTAGGALGLSVLETSVRVPTKLGINGAAPQTPLDIIANGSGYAMAVRGRSADDLSQIRFTSNDYGTLFAELESDATYLATRIGGSEKLRVDSSGRLLVGTSTARSNYFNTSGTHFPRLQVESANNNDGRAALALTYGMAATTGPYIALSKHRSNSIGGNTIVQENDELGLISFQGNDGAEFVEAATIKAQVDGTPGSNDMPGRLVFSTAKDNFGYTTTRLTIDSAGLSTFTGNIEISNTSPNIQFTDTDHNSDFNIAASGGNFVVRDSTNGQNRVVVASDGTVDIQGNLDANGGLDVTGAITGTAGLSIEGATVFNDAGADVDFRIEGDTDTNLFYLDASENRVGFSTNSPSAVVSIQGNGGLLSLFKDSDSNNNGIIFQDSSKNNHAAIWHYGTDDALVFWSGGSTERMRIDSSGRLLLGTTTGASTDSGQGGTLTIANTNPGITLRSGTSNVGSIYFSDGTSGSDELRGLIQYNHSSNFLRFFTDAGERMRIDSSGRVGIGCTPTAQFAHNLIQVGNQATLGANAALSSTGQTFLTHNLYYDTSGTLQVFNTSNANEGGIIQIREGYFAFSNSAATTGTPTVTERLRIDSSGFVGINQASPTCQLQVDAGASGDGTVTALELGHKGNNTNDAVKLNFARAGSDIGSIVLEKVSSNNTTDFIFNTRTSNTVSESMRISGSGLLAIGTTSPLAKLHADKGASNGTAGIFENDDNTAYSSSSEGHLNSVLSLSSTTTTGQNDQSVAIQFGLTLSGQTGSIQEIGAVRTGNGEGALIFRTRNSSTGRRENMRIHSSGRVRIKCEDMTNDPSSSNRGVMIGDTSTGSTFSNGSATTSANNIIFLNGNGVVGKISTSGSGTNYEETSDYRLKENEVVISDGITRLKQLKPYRFNFKADASTTVDGFFAHEAQQVVPEAVSGTKDETENVLYTEEDTIPSGKKVGDVKETVAKYQGIDHSKLVPLLVAAVQELIGKVEKLEAA